MYCSDCHPLDTRRTNLTRFPIVLPEKRTFFLQGANICDFGAGASGHLRPFFSRRMGLLNGNEVPIRAGLKVTGRGNGANVGALVLHIGNIGGAATAAPTTPLPATASTMGVLRCRQNVFRESSVGMILSAGDPLARSGSWMTGIDGFYQTSRFRGNKNFNHAGGRVSRAAHVAESATPLRAKALRLSARP